MMEGRRRNGWKEEIEKKSEILSSFEEKLIAFLSFQSNISVVVLVIVSS